MSDELTTDQKIQQEIDKAVKAKEEGDDAASLPKFEVLAPLISESLGEESRFGPAGLTKSLNELGAVLAGEAAIKAIEENGLDPKTEIIDPILENVLFLLMTGVSIASAGLIPAPSLKVIKKYREILKQIEAAGTENSNNSNNAENDVADAL